MVAKFSRHARTLLCAAGAIAGTSFFCVSLMAQPGILPQFDMKVIFPKEVAINMMPPVPDKLTVRVTASATLKNNSGKDELLTAQTSCAIHHWDVVDQSGRIVDSEKVDICLDIFQTYNLKAGETIRADHTVLLNGKVYKNGETYTLKYKFWKFQDEVKFVTKTVK